ncbi:MAG: hypothetical protein ACHQNA_12730 [Acidimicrobiales bacterium]
MPLRDKLTTRAQALLDPGDQVRHVFMTQSGMSPYSPIGGAIGSLLRKYWVVAVTDTQLVVMRASVFGPSKPKSVAFAVPRSVLAPDGKLWAKIVLGSDTHYLNRRFFKDVQAQDAELPGRDVVA